MYKKLNRDARGEVVLFLAALAQSGLKVDQKDIWLKHFLIKCPLHWKSQRHHSTTSIDTEKTTEII